MLRRVIVCVIAGSGVLALAACDGVPIVDMPFGGGYADGRLEARPGVPTEAAPRPGLHRMRLEGEPLQVYVPSRVDPERPAPFALLLHGAGGGAHGGMRIWEPYADRTGMILLAPESRHDGVWDAMLGGFGDDVSMIDRELRWVSERFRIDPERVAVGGFSNGATYALSLGLTNGDLFTHIVALSPGFVAAGEHRGEPRVFIAHGRDDRTLPIAQTSERIVPELRADGYDVTFVRFDAGHHMEPSIAHRALRWFLR